MKDVSRSKRKTRIIDGLFIGLGIVLFVSGTIGSYLICAVKKKLVVSQ